MPAGSTTVAGLLVALLLAPAVIAAPTDGAAPGKAATADELLVMYMYPSPPITKAQKEVALREAERLGPEGRRAWFICVEFGGTHEVWAWVVFAPDETTPRLRKGWFADVHVRPEGILGPAAVTSSQIAEDGQVARGDSRFAEKKGLPDHLPDGLGLPMRRPYYRKLLEHGERKEDGPAVPVPDAMVIELVDFARTVFDEHGVLESVCVARAIGKNRFLLASGVEDWGGHYFEATRRDGKFEAWKNGIGSWADSLNVFYGAVEGPYADEDADDAPRDKRD